MSTTTRRLQRASINTDVILPPGPGNITFAPAKIPLSEPEITNSGRGQLEWLQIPPDPAWWPTVDIYRRNPWEINWNTIETSRGVYDFAMIDTLLASVPAGGRLHFRIMTWFYTDTTDLLVPSYVPLQNTINKMPDWNSEAYLSGWEKLWQAIAKRYNDNPKVGFIDIGGFGAWSEWFFEDAWGEWATQASAARICDAVIGSMTNKYVIAPAPALVPGNDPGLNYGFRYAVSQSDRVGWRFDNVGAQEVDLSGNFWTQREQDTWKRAPIVTEWGPSVNANLPRTYVDQGYSNAQLMHISTISSSNRPDKTYGSNNQYNYKNYNTMSPEDQATYAIMMKRLGFRLSLTSAVMQTNVAAGSAMQVATNWRNEGVAPTYDPWDVELVLMDGSNTIVWQISLDNIVLKSVLPGEHQFSSSLTVPNLRGTFTAGIRAVDPANYLPPLRLANAGRTGHGVYPLGTIRLT